MTNSYCIALELKTKCDGSHSHQHLVGGRAKAAAKYPTRLCQAICVGLRNQLGEKQNRVCLMTVQVGDVIGEDRKEHKKKTAEHEEDNQEELLQAWDDVSGKELDGREVKKARMKEVGFVNKKNVWQKMSRKEALRKGYKIIQTRWIDIDKGDEDNPNYRSRLVGK